MNNIAIKAENLSKAYQLGNIGTGTISRDMERWWAKLRGKEDPFLKIGEVNDRAKKGESDVVWSLKDIDFEIKKGEAVGIIGRNGAGKSTLLKILSRVTAPTTGKISGNGRIASLLEVGTGFHPELTGRDNIYLNGAILGMRKKEIDRKFDEIVDFSGVERYIDTPVKRYSSGMYVRLAFAVAAHLESEILIVDEVLAVGDAEFQKKCLGKMGEVTKGEGRTVLFVSHNMGVVASLCQSAILLNQGQINYHGPVDLAIKKYVQLSDQQKNYHSLDLNKAFFVHDAVLWNDQNMLTSVFVCSENIHLKIKIKKSNIKAHALFSCTIQNTAGEYLSTFVEDMGKYFSEFADTKEFQVTYPANFMVPNHYTFRLAIFSTSGHVYDLVEMICPMQIIDSGTHMAIFEGNHYGYFKTNHEFTVING
jgi:lipopolysaccharide transport system ATP-binding protein